MRRASLTTSLAAALLAGIALPGAAWSRTDAPSPGALPAGAPSSGAPSSGAPAPSGADTPVPPPGVAGSFTPAQRDAIVAIVRQALVRDPSILADAIASLRAADQKDQAGAQASSIASHRAALLDATGDAIAGNPQGAVTLVEFYDPRCPYCRRMIPTVNREIAADRSLRVVFKVIPILGAPSTLAARAIVAAGRHGKYVAMQERLMLADTPPDAATIAAAARAIGLDPAALATEMGSEAVTRHLEANLTLAHAIGIDGTPAFVIGDTLVPGAMTEGELRDAIRSARG